MAPLDGPPKKEESDLFLTSTIPENCLKTKNRNSVSLENTILAEIPAIKHE
jgi:hypothetical protein